MSPHYIVDYPEFNRGNFRVKGDTVDIYPGHSDITYRIYFWGNEIEDIESIEVETSKKINSLEKLRIYPKYFCSIKGTN